MSLDDDVVAELEVVAHRELDVLEELGVLPHPLEDEGGERRPDPNPAVDALAEGGLVEALPEPEQGLDPLKLLLVGGGVVFGLEGNVGGVEGERGHGGALGELLEARPVEDLGEDLPHQQAPVGGGVGKALGELAEEAGERLFGLGGHLPRQEPGHGIILPAAPRARN